MSNECKKCIEELEKELEYTKRLLYENAIVSLLNGRMMADSYEEKEVQKLQLDFKTNSYILLSISVEEGEKVENEKCRIIDKVLSERLKEHKYVYHYLYHHACMNYIIASENEKMRKTVLNILEYTLKTVIKEHQFVFYAGVGSQYKTRSGISRSCRESRRALEYCTAEKKEYVVEYSDVPGGVNYNFFYSKTSEESLINAVISGNKERMNKELDFIFDACVVDEKLSLITVRLVASNLFDILANIFSMAGYSTIKVFPQEYEFMKNVYEVDDSEKIVHTIRSMFERCYDELFAEQAEKSVFSDNIINYINQNYLRADFNLQEIAENIGLSKGYLARTFKRKMGSSINEYIMIARINKAKVLLKDTNELIENIAISSGFSNYRTFSRAFQDVVGLLPKDYRKKYSAGYRQKDEN